MLLIRRPAPEEHAPYYGRYIELVAGEDPLRALREGAEETRRFLEPLPESKGDTRYVRVQQQCEAEITQREYRCAMKAPSPETWQACID